MTSDIDIEAIRNTVVEFESYYKYVFTFKGNFDSHTIYAYLGGSPEEIYRLNISRDEKRVIGDFDKWNSIMLKKEDGEWIKIHGSY